MTALSELDQMIQNGQGKSSVFTETLVGRYYDYIYRLAVSILNGPTDADDICQETFIDALLYINRYSPGTNLKAWLSKIAFHKCQAFLRRQKLRNSWEQAVRNMHNIFHNSPAEMIVQSENKREIWSKVNSLNDKHRIPIILFYVYDFKIREISGILDIPEGTVCSRLFHAVQDLGSTMQEIDKE